MLFVELRFGPDKPGRRFAERHYIWPAFGVQACNVGLKPDKLKLKRLNSKRAHEFYFRIAACALRFSKCQRWNVLIVSAGIKRT